VEIAVVDVLDRVLASDETEVYLVRRDKTWTPACGFGITRLDPSIGFEGDEIRIEGGPFADEAGDNIVRFRDPATDTVLMANVVGADLHETDPVVVALRVVVPVGAEDARRWEVSVERNGVESNELTFRIGSPFVRVDTARDRWLDVNNSGQVVAGNYVVTPVPGENPGDPPRWYVDDDGDGENDLFVRLTAIETERGVGHNSGARLINDTGNISGAAGILDRRLRDEFYAAFWSDPDMAVNVTQIIMTHVQEDLFPEFGISYVMMPISRGVVAMSSSNALLDNTGGAKVIRGTDVTWLGGLPECRGCIRGRLNVGNIRYASAHGVDINDAGVVVGTSREDDGRNRPAMWDAGGNRTFLGELLVDPLFVDWDSGPRAINSSGQIVGFLPSESGSRPVIWEGTTPRGLGHHGGPDGEAHDINDHGQIVGWMRDETGQQRGVLILPQPAYGVDAGIHRFTDLIDVGMPRSEYPVRITETGFILTTEGRLFRPR